ncbi:unnamed protein product [Schistosoma mattheei]|uniref:Uncharacterized protein n=1 Tax=Schistosoma mattheei TaxID=31246 RepID=A0A3P8BJW2_9TREM|nr:unnamed protein product [Schistosoma mattheei]
MNYQHLQQFHHYDHHQHHHRHIHRPHHHHNQFDLIYLSQYLPKLLQICPFPNP